MRASRPGSFGRHAEHDVVPESLHRRIAASIATTPSARIRTSTRTLAALAVAGALTALAVVIASELVYEQPAAGLNAGLKSAPQFITTSILVLALAGTATILALRRGRTGLGADAVALAMMATLVAPLYAVFTWVDPVHAPGTGIADVFVSPWGARCLLLAALVGAIVLTAFTLALRRAVPVATSIRAAALGTCAGAWAGMAVFVFCPSGDQHHVFFGHVLPIVAFTALGALLAPRALRP